MTLDLSDRDLSARFETKEKGKTTNLDLVVVGKTVYARDGGKKMGQQGRGRAPEQNIADVIRALPSIREPAHLAYVGLQTVGDVKLHHLTAVRKFSYQMSIGQTASYDTFGYLGQGGRHTGPHQGHRLGHRSVRRRDQGDQRTALLQVRRAR